MALTELGVVDRSFICKAIFKALIGFIFTSAVLIEISFKLAV